MFPLDTAPWPLLMPLVHSVPLSEADYIWQAFQGNLGSDRYHSYGPYNEDDKIMLASLQPSKWFWDAWPDRIVHGGVCVPLSLGTVDFYSGLGKPATWAGQPGHCNLISFQHVDGAWTAEIEQSFAGGPDQTSAGWYFDEDPGMPRFRDLAYWPGSEYHLGLALAMNVGLKPYVDTRIAANIYRILPDKEKATLGVKLLRNALVVNPYNPEIWYRLAEQVSTPGQGVALTEAAMQRDPARLSGSPGGRLPLGATAGSPGATFPQKSGTQKATDQYWQTLAKFVAQYALLSHGDTADLCNGPTAYRQSDHTPPQADREMRDVYDLLKTVPGLKAGDLSPYFDKFVANAHGSSAADAVQYDLSLGNSGDAFGMVRMGQRYRDGDGVPRNDLKAQDYLLTAAGQGDVVAASLLDTMNPAVPAALVRVTPSSVYNPAQTANHLIDGSGMSAGMHDNDHLGNTMWFTVADPQAQPPAPGLPPSPASVRFDFAQPIRFESIRLWNENQDTLSKRGFHMARIYGSIDGSTWMSLTASPVVELPRANGSTHALPVSIPNAAATTPVKSVIIAAEAQDGNYGDDYYGLSAVRFVVHRLPPVIPADAITVSVSSTYSPQQSMQHLIDGSGMVGAFHDNAHYGETMWFTVGSPTAQAPARGLAASPAWARFDFDRPRMFDSLLIWNENQDVLTARGLHETRIYGSSDGTTWLPLTSSPITELPRASGLPSDLPYTVRNVLAGHPLKSVIIAAEAKGGNYGDDYFGLSAVRFVARQ